MHTTFLISLAVPLIFFALTALVKTLVRGGFRIESLYQGVDLALASLAAGVAGVVDGLESRFPDVMEQRVLIHNLEFLIIGFFILLVVMLIHQHFENKAMFHSNPQFSGLD